MRGGGVRVLPMAATNQEWEKKSMEQMRHLLHGHSCRWFELLRYLGEAMLQG